MNTRYYSAQDDISYTPLSPEEEKQLFVDFGKGDLAARNRIIHCHLKLAAKLAIRTAKGALPEPDAISAGNFGLLKALGQFDPERGVRFATYCRHYVFGEVRTALRFASLNSDRHRQECHGKLPEDALVTGIGGYGENHAATRHAATMNGAHPCAAVDPEVEENNIQGVRREMIEKILDTLPALERAAIRGEFYDGVSFAETARNFGVTREGVRKAYVRGMKKITENLSLSKGDLL